MTEQPATSDSTLADDIAAAMEPQPTVDPEENYVDARESAELYEGDPDDLPRDLDGVQDDLDGEPEQ